MQEKRISIGNIIEGSFWIVFLGSVFFAAIVITICVGIIGIVFLLAIYTLLPLKSIQWSFLRFESENESVIIASLRDASMSGYNPGGWMTCEQLFSAAKERNAAVKQCQFLSSLKYLIDRCIIVRENIAKNILPGMEGQRGFVEAYRLDMIDCYPRNKKKKKAHSIWLPGAVAREEV